MQGTAWITLPDSLRALVSQSLVRDKLECPPWHFSVAKFGGKNNCLEFQLDEDT